jgi:hypothetical protein
MPSWCILNYMQDESLHNRWSGPIEEGEFLPLPYYNWAERPWSLPLDQEEGATALFLAHGSIAKAAFLLKVPIVRLNRLIRAHPRLQRIKEELLETVLDRADSVVIDTLFDENADARRLEWASKDIRSSKFAAGRALSPAPASAMASVTMSDSARTITYRWRTAEDPDPNSSVISFDSDPA